MASYSKTRLCNNWENTIINFVHMCSLVHTTENIMHSDPVSLFELRYGRSPHFLLALGEYKVILTDEFHHHEAVTRKLYPMIIHRPPILQ